MRTAALACALTLALGCPARASAQAATEREAIEGRVLELSEGELVLDIAQQRGASDGALVELWRPITVKHPVTGANVSDRFLIGRLKLVQVREVLSLARAEGKLARAAQAGDVVILRALRPASQAAVPVPTATTNAPAGQLAPAAPSEAAASERVALDCAEPKSGAAGRDADTQHVSELFENLRGQSPRTRILAYENYVKRRPKGRFAAVLYEEAQHLRQLLGLLSSRDPVEREPSRRSFLAPVEALAGHALSFGVEVDDAVGAVLHSRTVGELAYVSTPMRPSGDGYFAATIPAERVSGKRFEYFIEATTPLGRAVEIVGGAASPFSVPVDALPAPRPPERRDAIISLSTDYADWNNWKGNDVVWQTEGFVGMRLDDKGIRAVRTGFGVLRGVGGSLRELDELGLGGRAVGLTYGYLEGEFGASHFTSFIARLVIGLEDAGVAGGAQLLLRLGNDRATNLQIGGEVLGSVGLRGITQLELNGFEKVPVLLRTEVTNQPAGVSRSGELVRPEAPGAGQDVTSHDQGEVGARAIAQVGYRLLPKLVVAVRGSYQGRTINHAGPGVGGAVSYQW